ncbi:MAG: hypothetical protein ACRDRZ_03210 [Pseudonocardiaceae bacterium]
MGGVETEVVPLHPPFDVSFRGFHRRQVLDHIESLEGRMALVAADRDDALRQAAELSKLLDHLRRESEEIRARLERVQAAPDTVAGASERLHRMMVLAEDETAELRNRTDQELTARRAAAEADAMRLGEEARQAREQALEQRRALIAEGRAEAGRLVREAADGCRRLEAESETRRTRVQQELEATIAHRRAEADEALHRQETLGVARMELLVRMVGDEIRRRSALLDRRAAELEELQLQVACQLATAHSALLQAVSQLPLPVTPTGGPAELSGEPPEAGRHRRLLHRPA